MLERRTAEGEGADGTWPMPNEDNYDSDSNGWDDTPITYNLPDVLNWVNAQGGFAYAAHPADHPEWDLGSAVNWYLGGGGWETTDYNLVDDGNPNNDYVGLEIWNTINEEDDLQTGLTQWRNLLLNNNHIFIAAGSDAHGDFSHQTTALGESDNAFGKVRTVVYVPGHSQSNVPPENKILDALRNGRSVITDGPLVAFYAETAMVGENITVEAGNDVDLLISAASTPEFGERVYYSIYYGIIGETENILSIGGQNLEKQSMPTQAT